MPSIIRKGGRKVKRVKGGNLYGLFVDIYLQKRYNIGMKKVIEAEGICCKRCCERVEKKLRLLEGVTGAKANFKKSVIFVESTLPDDELKSCVEEAGFQVVNIRPRRGIFG